MRSKSRMVAATRPPIADESRVILRTAMDGFWVVDTEGRFLEANAAYCRLIGYSRAELLAMTIRDVEAVESPEDTAAHIATIMRTGSERFTTRHRRKDGAVLDIEVSANYLAADRRFFVFVRDVTERQRLQAELLEANETLERRVAARTSELEDSERLLLESQSIAGLGSYVLDLSVGRWSSSPVLDEIFGVDRHFERSIEGWASIVHPDWRERMERYFRDEVVGAARRFDMEYPIVRKSDGTVRWVHGLGELEFDAEGRPTRMVGTIMDITERRLADDALRKSARDYRALFESANDPIIIFEPEDRIILEANGRACATYGYLRDELLGSSMKALTKDAERGGRIVRELLRTGVMTDLESIHVRKDGTHFDVLVSASAIEFRGGRAIQAIVRDMTQRKRADAALRLQSAALNAAANAIVITSRDGTIEWINAAFSALSGYSAEEAVGRNPRDLVRSGVHEKAFYEDMWATLLAGSVWRGEMTNRRKDGSQYPEFMTITPVKDADGEIRHFVAIKRDLTDQRKLEAQFLQAQKMEIVGRLAGGVAHDFNNLLTVINGTAEQAREALHPDDPLRTDLQVIQGAGDRAAALTRQLLAFSRKQVLQPKVLNLTTLVAGLQHMLRRLIGEDIAMIGLLAEDLAGAMADPGQIEQVILNLVVNARDAMPGGGTLTIETRNVELDGLQIADSLSIPAGPYVMLAVTDSGVGMDGATRLRIFEPFFTTKGPGRGTGLGLSTVYGIVKQSGGGVSVYSEVGRGTTFRVYLPRTEQAAPVERAAGTSVKARGTETIVVVEDDEAIRQLVRRTLGSAGYRVLVAASAEDALPLLERHDGPVHLMLTDIVMPGMSGPDLAARASQVRPTMKILFTSGYTDHTVGSLGALDSGTSFISKPYAGAELTRRVREVLDA